MFDVVSKNITKQESLKKKVAREKRKKKRKIKFMLLICKVTSISFNMRGVNFKI